MKKEQIKELIKKTIESGALMKFEEYEFIANSLVETPGNLVVFGTGYDSYLWNEIQLSLGKDVIFYENNKKWIEKMQIDVREKTHYIDYPKIYKTTVENTIKDLSENIKYKNSQIETSISDYVKFFLDNNFTNFIVDSPVGDGPRKPGRLIPIYIVKQISKKKNGMLILDDHTRRTEKLLIEFFNEKKLPIDDVNGKVVKIKF